MAAQMQVVVVGDGPAGSAAARSLTEAGVAVTLVGSDARWHATYGSWFDDLGPADGPDGWGSPTQLVGAVSPSVRVATDSERSIERPYAVLDNDALRQRLRQGLALRVAMVDTVTERDDGGLRLGLDDGSETDADLVIDATGWPSRLAGSHAEPMAWQSAYGVVLAEPPEGPLGAPTIMDWSPPGGVDEKVPTFAYALPVDDGWLVEETVLASREVVEPDELRPVLARRLGWELGRLDREAIRVERVRIPMGAAMRGRGGPGGLVVPFGAAAGLAHPATGYQVAASLFIAGDLAARIAVAIDAGSSRGDVADAAVEAIWPTTRQRTRRLHEFGLDVLLRLDPSATRVFFETFFELPVDVWRPQMRIESTPRQIAAVMTRMFMAAPWSLRRRLVCGDLRLLAAVVRRQRLRADEP